MSNTYISMVLDRSGSMASCCEATIASVNTYLSEARGDENMKEAAFQLVIFDSQSIDTIRDDAIVNVKDIGHEDYVPRGGTPLYDAIGRGIDTLEAKIAKDATNKAILVIVTDGQENASTKYTHTDISERIKGKQAAGWMVVFLGAGLAAAQQGMALGVRASLTATIATDAASLRSVSNSLYRASSSYAATAGGAATMDFVEQMSFSDGDRKAMGDATGGAALAGVAPVGGATPLAAMKAPDSFARPKTDAWAS